MDYEMKCGCVYLDDGFESASSGLTFCPLHAAAPSLLTAAQELLRHFSFRGHLCSRCDTDFPAHKDTCQFAPLAKAVAQATR